MTSRRHPVAWARRVSTLVVVGGVIASLAAGCGSSKGGSSGGGSTSGAGSTTAANGTSKPFTIGLMVLTLKNQAYVTQVAEMRRRVEAAGGKLVVMDPDDDPAKQLQLAQDWLAAGKVQAIMGSTVDVNAFQPALDEAAQKGVPVVLLGFQPKTLHRGQLVITQDFRDWGVKGGTAVARCLNERYGGKGEVAIVGGPNLPGPVVKDRMDGMRQAIMQNAPAAKIYEQDGDATRVKALQLTQTMLQAQPGINAASGTGDEEVLGEMQALKGAGKDLTKLCIVGMAGTPEGLAALHAHQMYADIDIGLPAIYDATVKATVALVKNPNDPRYSGQTRVLQTFAVLYH